MSTRKERTVKARRKFRDRDQKRIQDLEADVEFWKSRASAAMSRMDMDEFGGWIGTRSENALRAEDICSVRDLLRWSEPELLRVVGVGKITVDDIVKALAGYGLKLSGTDRGKPRVRQRDWPTRADI